MILKISPSCRKLKIMKRILIGVFLIVLSLSELVAQENSLLWEISKKRYKTSYLFGTIHSSDSRVFSFGETVLPALYKCKAYAGEIIMQPEDALAILPYLFEKDKTKQCKNVLNEEEYALVSAAFSEKLGKEMLFMLPSMTPYLASIMIGIPNEYTEENPYFLDMYLQEQADSLHKKLISLESIENQYSYINSIEIEKQKNHLLKIVNNMDSHIDDIEELLAIYLKGDLKGIEALLSSGEDEDPIMTPKFMIERNETQVKGIIAAMLEQSTFIGVGAAHLPGENGLLRLLEENGFTIRPIFY